MRVAVALSLTLAQTACVATVPSPTLSAPVRVTNQGLPFQMWDGAAARVAANAQCGTGGVKTSVYDSFDPATGAWIFPGGCA